MCGIAGFLDLSSGRGPGAARVSVMADTLVHRGPDGRGVFADDDAGIALGHRRLAIIDLSPAGDQPMRSASGRYVLVYNGEIYNFPDLRRELEAAGHRFRGHSDTEVLVEGIARWGTETTLRRLNGIFAFALWDREARTLTLARDPLGVKPLYWGRFGGLFLFGSELRALRAHPGWRPEISRDALAQLMRHNYIGAPNSIYCGVEKLSPGSVLTVRAGQSPRIERFWDFRAVAKAGLDARRVQNPDDAVSGLHDLLLDAVRRQMIADVPLGTFLSGGVDSSTVAALAQASSSGNVRTFSIGFHEAGYNEADHALAVARHLGTDHTELYVDERHALDMVPKIPDWFDEPFADSSQLPTFLVSEMTRRRVTVALSGDGGDELFAGYNRYLWGGAVWDRIGWLPAPWRRHIGKALARVRPSTWDRWTRALPAGVSRSRIGEKAHKLAQVLGQEGQDALYRGLLSHWADPESLVPGSHEPKGVLWDASVADDFPDFIERMQFLDGVTYLPDDILTKVDRTSMAVSLEARVPLLDTRVVAYAWGLPPALKIRGGQSKWALRQVLYRYVPAALIDRPKMGFGAPIAHWLRGPLRDWAEHLLDEKRLGSDGLLNPVPIRARWSDHVSGERDWAYSLWNVLMFEAWKERWTAQAPPGGYTIEDVSTTVANNGAGDAPVNANMKALP